MSAPFDVTPRHTPGEPRTDGLAAAPPARSRSDRGTSVADEGSGQCDIVELAVPLSEAVRSEVDACVQATARTPLLSSFLLPPHPTLVRLVVAVAGIVVALYSVVETDLTRLGDAAARFPFRFLWLPAMVGAVVAVAVTAWRRPVLASEWADQLMLWLLAAVSAAPCAASRAGPVDGYWVMAAWAAVFVQLFHASRSFRVNRAWLTLRWPYLAFVATGVLWALLAAPLADRLIREAQR